METPRVGSGRWGLWLLLAAGQDRAEAGHQGTAERWRSRVHDVPAGAGKLLRKHPKESESEVAQSCPTLCDPMDCSLPDSSVHGLLQARILEWVAISFSRESSQPRDRTGVSCMQADALPSEPPGKSFFFCIVSLAPSVDKTSAPAPQEKLDQSPFSQASPKPRIMWN